MPLCCCFGSDSKDESETAPPIPLSQLRPALDDASAGSSSAEGAGAGGAESEKALTEVCLANGAGAENEEVLKATANAPWLEVEGEQKDEAQPGLIGRYKLVPGKWINGHGVWRSEGSQKYLHLALRSGKTEWWISESEEDIEVGAARGLAMVKGGKKALTPMHAGTTGWKVRANGNKGTKGKGKAGSVAGFVGAPELKARGPGQHDGDHFTQGISVQGVKLAFRAMGWDKYERNEDGLLTELRKEYCPYNKGPANGYDMCALVKRFIKGKGQTHLSFVEAVKVLPELAHIRAEVGAADGFYSHVQAETVKVTEAGLAEAAERYANVLREDREGTRRLRRAALVAFFQEHSPQTVKRADELMDKLRRESAEELVEFLKQPIWSFARKGIAPPDLASLRASKPADEPTRFFLDYLCVRQCIAAADFSTERVVRAIATIGITVVELGADWRSESALLRRLFCVIELFATVKAGGRLLVVGPAFEDPKQVQELLQVATSKERSVEVMDSRDEKKTRCRFPDEAKEIRAYIEGSVGYVKLDRQVLSAIGVGCMDRVQAQMEAKKRQDQAADMMYGLAQMLMEAEEFTAALEQAKRGLGLRQQAKHGDEGAVAVAKHLVQVGECMSKAAVGTDGQVIAQFEQAKAMYDREYGEGHLSTADCLVGIGRRYLANWSGTDYQKALDCGQAALAVVEGAGKGGAVEAEGALALIGDAHIELEQWDEAMAHFERRLRVLLAHHGEEGARRVAKVAEAYRQIGAVYLDGKGDKERALEYFLKAVPVAEEATGKLSNTTGLLCGSIGFAYKNQQRYAEAVPWYEKRLAAYTFTYGAENEQRTKRAVRDLEDAKRGAAQQQQQ